MLGPAVAVKSMHRRTRDVTANTPCPDVTVFTHPEGLTLNTNLLSVCTVFL